MNVDNDSIQVIDENKVFNSNLLPYLTKYYQKEDDSGLNYHIVSVFGSQSTGKSTLLNHLFGTRFDVMSENQRQQTTKGIWLAHAKDVAHTSSLESGSNSSIFVMDVEGTDGRERGEDQDFERKSALFALSTSEILIVNIWEHQVGLYQGANMGLLKTVFEVNLALFAQNRKKSCLLFVIRDHIGVTPLENLSRTLTEDLDKIWSQLNKPAGTEDSRISDFFDLKFWALPHKLLQNDQFLEKVAELGDALLLKDMLFSSDYHRQVPIDGWSIYAQNIWEQIELNKDLDLPTQQILVARFRCDEIANESYDNFHGQFNNLDTSDELPKIGTDIETLRTKLLQEYDLNALRYTKTVYLQRRVLLKQKIDTQIKELYDTLLSSLSKQSISKFKDSYVVNKKQKGSTVSMLLQIAFELALSHFNQESKFLSILDDNEQPVFNNEKELAELTTKLVDIANKEKEEELKLLIKKLLKKFNNNFKDIVYDNLSNPHEESWDKILEEFHTLVDSLLSKYKNGDSYDFELELTPELNESTSKDIIQKCWIAFDQIIHDFTTEDNVLNILKNKFDEFFRYDEKGLPKVWESTVEIDNSFTIARSKTLELLPILAIAKLSSNVEILPEVSIEQDQDDDDEDDEHQFAHLLSAKQEQSVIAKFKKQIDLIYTDAKRSIVHSKTSIPLYFYLLLLVLGWNEFMAILRSPVLFTFLLISLLGFYVAYNLQMLGLIMHLSMTMIDQTQKMVKEKLREVLIEDQPQVVNEKISLEKST